MEKLNGFMEIHTRQQEEFNNYIASLKSIELEAKENLEKHKEKYKVLLAEIDKTRQANYDIELIKKDVEKKFSEANVQLESSAQKEKYHSAEIKRLEQRNKELDIREASIQSRIEASIKREQEIDEKFKWLKIEERSIKVLRMEVEAIIRDNKLKIKLGETDG